MTIIFDDAYPSYSTRSSFDFETSGSFKRKTSLLYSNGTKQILEHIGDWDLSDNILLMRTFDEQNSGDRNIIYTYEDFQMEMTPVTLTLKVKDKDQEVFFSRVNP